MKPEEIEQIVDDALITGIIEAECTQCGITLQCEADANTAFCQNCNETVTVRNILQELGFL